jgi:CPA2 family monovalent cation:H+ antiporter-2
MRAAYTHPTPTKKSHDKHTQAVYNNKKFIYPLVTDLFGQILFVLLTTIIVVALVRRLHYPPIIGYMIVGLIISLVGQHSFDHFNNLRILAHYGVVFLLFSIGLEFSLTRLLAMRKTVFGLGSLQMIICGGLAFLICNFIFKLAPLTSFIIAVAVAMSSTAIISKILDEGGELSTKVGQLSMSMLIFQDLMVVPAIIITSFFAHHTNSALLSSLFVELVKGLVTFVILILIGKKIFTPIFHEVARAHSSELFTLATLFAALSAAYFSEMMGMSKEFGAFLAGAIIGGTPYHHQVESDIRPFRDVLLGIFFIGVGTMINIHVFAHDFLWVLLVSFIILIGKLVTINYLVYFLKLGHPREASRIGLLLAQAGEFGFVLIALATHYNFLGDNQAQILLAALITSMLLSIITLHYQNYLLPWINKLLFFGYAHQPLKKEIISHKNNMVIICGYSRIGQSIAKALTGQGFHYLALDLDPQLVNQAQLAGEEVIYADATDPHILRHLHTDKAKAMILTFQDPALSMKVIEHVRLFAPEIPIFARTKNDTDIPRLLEAGATEVIPDMLEASLMLSLHVLVNLGVDLKKAVEWSENLRRDRYQLLQGYFQGEANRVNKNSANEPQQKALMIYEHFYANGKTIHQLHIGNFNLELVALRKKGILGQKPSPNTKVHAGDVLIVQGLKDNIEKFEWLLLEG